MISKVDSNPEMIYVGSDFKTVGKSIELNRERLQLTSQTISRGDRQNVLDRLDQIDDDGKVDESEKAVLVRELARIDNDMATIRIETRDADLAESQQWENLLDAYQRIHDLMDRIVNSQGVYEASDVYDLNPLYDAYLDAYEAMETIIFAVNNQYIKAKVVLDIQPNVVSAKDPCVISIVLDNDGVDRTSLVDPDNVSFGLSGLANGFTSSLIEINTTLYPHGTVTVGTGNTATVSGCLSFTLLYDGLSDDGVNVNAVVRIDTDSIPT